MTAWLGRLLVAGALLAFPCVMSGPFYERMGALVLLYAISASAWNLVGGYAGQISVGHAVFFGAGAYMALLVYDLWGLTPLAVANWPLLGAAIGLSGPVVPRTVLDLSFRSAVPYYYLFLTVLALLLA